MKLEMSCTIDHLNLENPLFQLVVSLTRDAVPEPPAITITSDCRVKAIIPKSPLTEIGTDPWCKSNPASLQSLNIKCDNVYK